MMIAKPTSESSIVSAQMRAQRIINTEAELAVRRSLHGAALRYRKYYPYPGRPRRSIDVAFPGKRVAFFIDGCFWHGCTAHRTVPKSNGVWWQAKLNENRRRDRDTTEVLVEQGWTVLRFWEHDAQGDVLAAVASALALPTAGEADLHG